MRSSPRMALTMSMSPSPSTSSTATPCGWSTVSTDCGVAKVPFPLPRAIQTPSLSVAETAMSICRRCQVLRDGGRRRGLTRDAAPGTQDR